jgi:thiamine biosynthesis protein ThiS
VLGEPFGLRVLSGRPLEPDPGSAGVGKANRVPSLIALPAASLDAAFFIEPSESRRMNITLNGEKRAVPDSLTVLGLLEHLNIQTEKVAVERNLEIVKKAAYDATVLREGDILEVVSFMAGGDSIADFGLRIGIKDQTGR